MPSRFIKQNTDINVWGAVHNDSLHPVLNMPTSIRVTLNSNNPPTVQSGTKFFVYGTDAFTSVASPVTGNNVYPANTSITYIAPSTIFELADRTFTWGTGLFPSISNSTTYYLYCTGAEDTNTSSRGKGTYGASTNAPTYDHTKGGWYSSDGLVIACFYVTSGGVVTGLVPLSACVNGVQSQTFQYIEGTTYKGVALTVTGTNWTTVRGVFVPYQTIDGAWRVRFNINGTLSVNTSSLQLTVAGITGKNVANYYQGIVSGWLYDTGTSTNRICFSQILYPNAGTIQIISQSGTFNRVGCSGDVELESKPTWAV